MEISGEEISNTRSARYSYFVLCVLLLQLISNIHIQILFCRELSLARMRDLDIPCKDIRTREVGMKQIQEAVSPDDVELIRRDYVANGGWETFLSYEDPEKDILIGEFFYFDKYSYYPL